MKPPQHKKAWQRVCQRLHLTPWRSLKSIESYITCLPDGSGTELRVPVPLILVELSELENLTRRLARHRLHLAWSTLFLVPGYHHPQGTDVKCLTRPPDSWWTPERLNALKQKKEENQHE
jgi:hypothetical protein